MEDELRTKEFNRITDYFFSTNKMTAEDYEILTPAQRTCIQWAKRAMARVEAHDRKTN